jgi:hypothetical protein
MRRLPRWVLVALAVLGTSVAAAAAVKAVRSQGEPTFRMKATPVRTTLAPGGSVRVAVDLTLVNGFRAPILIGLGYVPRDTKAVWRLPDGRTLPRAHHTRSPRSPRYKRSAMLPVGIPAGTKKVFVDITLPPGFRGSLRPQVRATSGDIRRRQRIQLITATGERFQAPSRSFVVVASPASRTVLQGDVTQYDLEVLAGANPVLAVRGLPEGATGTFGPPDPADPTRRTLTVETTNATPVGAYDLTVAGWDDGLEAYAATSLVVAETKDFELTGDVTDALTPGLTSPVDLRLRNPYDFPLSVTALAITLASDSPACDAAANFTVRQPPVPLTLPPGESTIDDLVPDPDQRPAVTMLALPIDQEACKNVSLSLGYTGLAGKLG